MVTEGVDTSETLQQWRALRIEQDREYEESLRADREKVSQVLTIYHI